MALMKFSLLARGRVEQQVVGSARTARGADDWPCLRASRIAPGRRRLLRAASTSAVGQVEEVVRGDADVARRRCFPASSPRGPCACSWRPSPACFCRAPAASRAARPRRVPFPCSRPLTSRTVMRAAAGGDAAARPVPAICCRRANESGNVGLQRDAGAAVSPARAVERPHEGLGGEVHVAVFLHVEIDEFRHDLAVGAGEAAAGRRADRATPGGRRARPRCARGRAGKSANRAWKS